MHIQILRTLHVEENEDKKKRFLTKQYLSEAYLHKGNTERGPLEKEKKDVTKNTGIKEDKKNRMNTKIKFITLS